MKSSVLKILKQAGGYVSGQDICEKLSVSRTAVWKAVRQLEAEGYRIEAVRNRGYRLTGENDLLNREELESSISTEWAAKNLLVFDEIDSTNNVIKKAAEEGAPHGTLAVADYQSGGKGRRGRSWVSPHGVGIWMSILLRPENLPPSHASMLTLVCALAVAGGIREVTGLGAGIKWPNDIVVNGKKVCGILTEMSSEMESIHYVVPGIGINCNTKEFPEELKGTATSLLLETGAPVKRSRLVGAVMKALEGYYAAFMETGDMSALLETYNSMLVNRQKEVRVLEPGKEYTALALGIDASGALLVRKEDGQTEAIISGEVSVRGIYGYV